ncbi:MAG: hypothetical protein QQN62_03855 [Nitrosopumilus sp.]
MITRKRFKTPNPTPGDFFDRFTILVKKVAVDPKHHEKLVQMYVGTLNDGGLDGDLLRLLCELQMANLDVWFYESEIRAGKDGELGLKEIGKRALAIREFNAIRINKINKINKLFNVVEEEKKINHASESDINSL